MAKWVRRIETIYDKDTGETVAETHWDEPLINAERRAYFAAMALQGAAYSCIPPGEIHRVVDKAVMMANALIERLAQDEA